MSMVKSCFICGFKNMSKHRMRKENERNVIRKREHDYRLSVINFGTKFDSFMDEKAYSLDKMEEQDETSEFTDEFR
ncbi:hypothetical protein V1477_017885 [Vespula maculifrons]|uniref:Uncharacterized protein n=1 Tax=Vespula maculifrons TaxID=7453 RepID=A0ABD2AZM3_VESMC